jgi:hypothetical protein
MLAEAEVGCDEANLSYTRHFQTVEKQSGETESNPTL